MQVAELRTAIEGLSKEKSKAIEEKEKAIAEFKKTHDSLVSEMSTEIKKGEIAITQLRDKLSVNMVDKVLFDSGSAEVKKEGKLILKRVGDILKKVSDKQIKVEGHTDNVPISQKLMVKFPSNWELSSARATNVAKYLQDSAGLNPKLLTVAGYSEYRPIESNDTPEGRAKNRRIEIVLIPLDIDRITKGP
jgi:chemotaxis protein MotB